MSLESIVLRYIASAEHVFEELEIEMEPVRVNRDDVEKVLNSARAYLADAKYYKDGKKLDVSLTSVAYCEGLLDALRMLGTVRFEWPNNKTGK